VNPPALNQHGGFYLPAFTATLTNPNPGGTIYYTLNGSDPRLTGGTANPAATVYSAPFALTGSPAIKARVLQSGTWSALTETSFTPETDRDHDGIPNDWETTHGLDPDTAADALLDPDEDGTNNLSEYAANTGPQDRNSVFTAIPMVNAAGRQLRFTAQPGRHYRLEASDQLSGWSTIADRPAVSVTTEVDWLIPPGETRRFYRIAAGVE
jgi:hypothetical protein